MIRRGKEQGWLSLPARSLHAWSSLNGVTLHGIGVGSLPGHENKGSAIEVQAPTLDCGQNPLMTVPSELILSKENVILQAKTDKHLRDLLEAVGEFGRTARGAILLFLLVQATHSCPDIPETIGVSCAFTEYIKFLPLELLPTFWTEQEMDLLKGTSLAAAMQTKIKSLYREFDHLRSSTSHVEWCKTYWWDDVNGGLTFDDWKQVDAMYRSRALEFPHIGDAMVPCIDMANHASGELTAALYEPDKEGNALLLLRDNQILSRGHEVTITYGDEKGACEMLFSYGFIEDGMSSARDILLDLEIPDDDPLKPAKKVVSTCPPGMRLIDTGDLLRWESEYIWIICVNEEDGLEFKVSITIDGKRELSVGWNGEELQDTSKLKTILQATSMWNVYQLRAVSLAQDRVEQQLRTLLGSNTQPNQDGEDELAVRDRPRALSMKLNELETVLLERFNEFFEKEKLRLLDTEAVRRYLDNDDFS